MKKHENAIKALMKNVKDNEKWYGYFEDESGARYLMNTHIVIKLTGSTLDYVGELPRLDNIKLIKQFIDFIETFKKGEYSAIVNIQDIKIFDRYNTDKKPFCVKYSDNGFIGFNPYYFNKLNILTGSDLLTITDNKSPIYIAGNDIECVLLPCCLGKDYNIDNYTIFLTALYGCYTMDQKQKQAKKEQKAHKNTDKIGKDVIYNGFTLYFAGRQLFILSDKKRVTNDITNDFLKIMSDITGIDYINKITENDYKYYKSGVQAATITKTTSYYGTEEIYRIETKYNSENFYKNEYDRLIIYNGNIEKIDICADDMSATDPETTETKTTDIVKADTCTDTDKAATTDTANNDSVTATQDIKTANTTTQDTSNNAITSETMQADATQDKPHKTSKKAMCLFIVTDKPAPVKLPTLKQLDRIPTYTQRIISRLQPLKSHRVYNNRVKELKPLKKACSEFVGTVSANRDKCAIGGKVATGNTS